MAKRLDRFDPKKHLSPARTVVEKIGGADASPHEAVAATAEAAGVDVSRVWRWMLPIGQGGGTGGVIPRTEIIDRLLDWSHKHGRGLRAEDFFAHPAEGRHKSAAPTSAVA